MDHVPFEQKRNISFKQWFTRHIAYSNAADELTTLYESQPESWKVTHFAFVYELSSFLAKNKRITQEQWAEVLNNYKEWVVTKPDTFDNAAKELQIFDINTESNSLYATTIKTKEYQLATLIFEVCFTLIGVCSPLLANNFEGTIPLWVLDSPLFGLEVLSHYFDNKTKLLKILPPSYQKALKNMYVSIKTRDALAKTIGSNKKAKKYLRILQKRLGIYPHKKPPFKK